MFASVDSAWGLPHDGPKGDSPKKDHGVLYIGMDLGTSRTSVSASNGVRESVYSMVGYPKDVVSMKLLKKDMLGRNTILDTFMPTVKSSLKMVRRQ